MEHDTGRQLYTIGHGNRKIDDFIFLLDKYYINMVIDVRTYPYSRFHSQFNQVALQLSLNKAGIKYLFLGDELGGRPKNAELYINGRVSYTAVKQTELFKLGINKLEYLVNNKINLTVMCSECDHNHCHRKHLITDEVIAKGIDVLHINKNGMLESHKRDETMSLFGG